MILAPIQSFLQRQIDPLMEHTQQTSLLLFLKASNVSWAGCSRLRTETAGEGACNQYKQQNSNMADAYYIIVTTKYGDVPCGHP